MLRISPSTMSQDVLGFRQVINPVVGNRLHINGSLAEEVV